MTRQKTINQKISRPAEIFFCPCPIPSCGRIYGRGDGIQKHFLQLHVDESWNDWMSERKKYYRKDFAQEPNALFVLDESKSSYVLKPGKSLINFFELKSKFNCDMQMVPTHTDGSV